MVDQVTINKKLNLVVPIDLDNGVKIWAHSVPISREVFESNYLLLTRTLSDLYANGIGPAMAPRIASLVLKATAKEMNSEVDISNNLLQEVYRLTNFIMPNTNNGGGWQTVPFYDVKTKHMIDDQSLSEVENAIIYFIVASALHLKSELPMAYQGLRSIWNAQTTSLNVTEYRSSLAISTADASIGEKQPPPVIPPQKVVLPKASSIPS
jgi:hypothetical protein